MNATTYTLHLDTNSALVRSGSPRGLDNPFNRTTFTTEAELDTWLAHMDLYRTEDAELLEHRPPVIVHHIPRPYNRTR